MTQEQEAAVQKAALAAARSVEQRDTPIATAIERSSVAKWFKAGAQIILENPGEWGLIDAEIHSNVVKRNFARTKEANQLQSQLTKYRGALERALQSLQARRPHTPGLGAPINIIKSVLEQEVNND